MSQQEHAQGHGNQFSNSEQAQAYARARPSYPAELYRTILSYCGEAPRHCCVDLATGSGQAARQLAEFYDE